ncbi:MAG: AraC family transcriptional regulator [Acutalibacteraceae bacterium]|nr:AraC family transcriptional regulator [Acutalibacteraceae bacterium]
MNIINKITVTDIKELFTVSSPRGRSEEIKNRKSYGLSFCAEGKITYKINGKQAVSDEKHAVILPKGMSYSLYGNKSGIFPVINFDCKELLCDEVISLPIQSSDIYIKDFEKMKALSLFEENRAKMMSVFYNILHRLSTESSVHNAILPAIKHIESNYQNPKLSNAELAEKCNISEVYFRKIFTETYKTTPKQFIVEIRINKAKQLLSDGFLNIGAVAEECGFSNQYHFSRLFKEKTGLTPTEYIKRNRVYKI